MDQIFLPFPPLDLQITNPDLWKKLVYKNWFNNKLINQ